MLCLKAVGRAVTMLQTDGKTRTRCEVGQTGDRDTVVLTHLVIIVLVDKSKSQHALLIQVGLMDTCEALGKDDAYVEEARLHGCMLAR